MLTRRGFLGTMLAAAAGAVANFDVSKGLWVPGCTDLLKEGAQVSPLALPQVSWTRAIAENQSELNDIALRFAQTMAPRLMKTKATVLRRMMLERVGHMDLGLITLTDDDGNHAGRGHYKPAVHRVSKDLEAAHRGYTARTGMDDAADQMFRDVEKFDTFAPIGVNLRDNVPFADCLVGTAVDPASGLSARALRFRTTDGIVHTECELAVGNWYERGSTGRARTDAVRTLLSPELCAAQEAQWQRENEDWNAAVPPAVASSAVKSQQDSDGERRDSGGGGIRMRYLKDFDIERG